MPISDIDEKLIYVYIVVGSVIRKDDTFLLVQEKKPSAFGLWNLPAGKAEKEFSLEENAAREVKEETGFDVKIIEEIGVFHAGDEKSVRHAYRAEIIGGELTIPEDEILDAKWLGYDEIMELNRQGKIRNSWVIEAIKSEYGK